jgi:hypothetical protein
MKIKKIIQSEFEGEHTDSVTLTMTCSKRLHLFKKALPSFVQYCTDALLVTKVLIFDDSSTQEDRFEMEKLAESLFPRTNIDFVYFDEMPTKYRHAYIMRHWLQMVKTHYVFHLEDDRPMIEYFSLKEAINIIKQDWEVAIVGYAQSLREFPQEYLDLYRSTEYGRNREIVYSNNNNYWVWPYIETEEIGNNMFMDSVRSKEGSEEMSTLAGHAINYWEMFVNYPPFGLQPSVMDVNKLRLIGTFDLVDKLEGSFGKKMYKHFSSIHSVKAKSVHLGGHIYSEKSAYEMNDSIR